MDNAAERPNFFQASLACSNWSKLMRLAVGLVVVSLAIPLAFAQGQQQEKPKQPAQKKSYKPGPDSLPQDGVPKGKLEGPTLFKSKVFAGTVRKYWVYVPAQYKADKAANVLVWQDGGRAINPMG